MGNIELNSKKSISTGSKNFKCTKIGQKNLRHKSFGVVSPILLLFAFPRYGLIVGFLLFHNL